MDIHKPKAAHSWRDFLIEIGTIIVGILIALALEQVAEEMRWKKAVAEARASIREEMAFNDALLQHRVRIQDCVAKQLDRIDTTLSAAESAGRTPALPVPNYGLSAQISDAQWQAARAAQTLAHFPHQELADLGRYYDTINTFKTNFLDQEGEAWRWLTDLDRSPHALSSSDVMQLRYQLRTARRNNTVISNASKTGLGIAEKMGVQPAKRSALVAVETLCAQPGAGPGNG